MISRWLGRRLPGYGDRVDELCEQLLEEMPVEHLKSRTVLAETTIGVVHVLRFTKYLKLGASHIEPHYKRRDQGPTQRLQTYKRLYASQDCRLENLPVVVVCRTAAQALPLEGFLHRFMRRWYPQMVMEESDSNELYSLDAQDVLLQQLHWRAQQWCDRRTGVLASTENALPEDNSSWDLCESALFFPSPQPLIL